jgi:hypothetical protein
MLLNSKKAIKRIALGVIIGITLLLDTAALHDILFGAEPDYIGEYGMLFLSIILFGGVYYIYEKNYVKGN